MHRCGRPTSLVRRRVSYVRVRLAGFEGCWDDIDDARARFVGHPVSRITRDFFKITGNEKAAYILRLENFLN